MARIQTRSSEATVADEERLGRAVSASRWMLGMSRLDLASSTGLTVAAVGQVEVGNHSATNYAYSAEKILAALRAEGLRLTPTTILSKHPIHHGRAVTAARVFLGWTREDLALAANLRLGSLKVVEESAKTFPDNGYPKSQLFDAALVAGGIEFLPNGLKVHWDRVRKAQEVESAVAALVPEVISAATALREKNDEQRNKIIRERQAERAERKQRHKDERAAQVAAIIESAGTNVTEQQAFAVRAELLDGLRLYMVFRKGDIPDYSTAARRRQESIDKFLTQHGGTWADAVGSGYKIMKCYYLPRDVTAT